MGLYDHVEYEAPCGRCGAVITHWQSKDGECRLQTVPWQQVTQFYAYCDSCGKLNGFLVTPATDAVAVRVE